MYIGGIMKLFFMKILILFSVSGCIAVGFSEYVVMADVDELLSSMVDISSALFAAVGIWVAYLYPEAISVLTERKNIILMNGIDHTRKVETLVVNMMVSASVLLTVLLLRFVQFIFENFPLFFHYKGEVKYFVVFVVSVTCLMQIYSLFSLMRVNVSFINRMHSVKLEKKATDDL